MASAPKLEVKEGDRRSTLLRSVSRRSLWRPSVEHARCRVTVRSNKRFAFSFPAYMAIAHVQGKPAFTTSASANSIAVTLTAAVGSSSSVMGVISGPSATTSITDDKGNTYNVADFDATSGTTSFYLTNITNGPSTITAHFSSSSGFLLIIADEYSGVGSIDVHTHGNVTSSTAPNSGSVTPTANGDLIYGATVNFSALGPITLSAGSGFTLRETVVASGDPCGGSEDQVQTTAASIAATFTATSGSYSTFIMAFKAAGTSKTVNLSGASVAAGHGTITNQEQISLSGGHVATGAGSIAAHIVRNATVNLSGAHVASSGGALAKTLQKSLTGVSLASAAGVFARSLTKSLSGAASATHAEAFAISRSKSFTLAGAAVASFAGALARAISKSLALTGTQSISAAGHLPPAYSKTVTLGGSHSASAAGNIRGPQVTQLGGTSVGSAAHTFSFQVGPTLHLVGAAVSAAAHTFGITLNPKLVGASAPSFAGAVGKLLSKVLSGSGVATSVGRLTGNPKPSLVGAHVATATGRFGSFINLPMRGADVISHAGTLAPTSAYLVQLAGAPVTSFGGTFLFSKATQLNGVHVNALAGLLSNNPGSGNGELPLTGVG